MGSTASRAGSGTRSSTRSITGFRTVSCSGNGLGTGRRELEWAVFRPRAKVEDLQIRRFLRIGSYPASLAATYISSGWETEVSLVKPAASLR